MAGMFPGLPIVMAPAETSHPFKDPKPVNSISSAATSTPTKPKNRKEREKVAVAQAAAKDAAEKELARQQEIQRGLQEQLERQQHLLEQQHMQLEHQRRLLEERRIAEDRVRAAAHARWELEHNALELQYAHQHAMQLQYAQQIQQGERSAGAVMAMGSTSGIIAFPEAATARGPVSPPQSATLSASSSGNGEADGIATDGATDGMTTPETTKSVSPAASGQLPSPTLSRSQSIKTNGCSTTAEQRGGTGLALVLDDLMAELGGTIESFQRDSVQSGSDHRASNNSSSNASVSDRPDGTPYPAPTVPLPLPPHHSPTAGRYSNDDLMIEADAYQFTVAFLLTQPDSFHGYLSKLSISRETPLWVWRRRFFVLTNARLFLFRSSDLAELPLTFLPITTATGGPTTPQSHHETDGQPPETLWILDVRGSGTGPNGTVVERTWKLQCADEPTLNTWLDALSSTLGQQMRHVHQHQQLQHPTAHASPKSPAGASGIYRRPSGYTDVSSFYSPFTPITPSSPTMPAMPMPMPSPASTPQHQRGVPPPPPISTSFPVSQSPPHHHHASPSFNASHHLPSSNVASALSHTSHNPHASSPGGHGNPGGLPMARRSSSTNASNGLTGSLSGSLPSYAVAAGPESPMTPSSAMSERQATQRQQYESYMIQLARQQAEAQAVFDQKGRERALSAAAAAGSHPALREMPMQPRTGSGGQGLARGSVDEGWKGSMDESRGRTATAGRGADARSRSAK
ncbi:hypothetical protein HK101_002929, partial [Irineochytrium annulatum]